MAGSAYTFSYASLGELPAWIIGWDLVLEFALGTAVVAVGWSGYIASLLDNAGWHLPAALGGREGADGFGFDILAAALVLVLTGILVLGMKLSARITVGRRRHQGDRRPGRDHRGRVLHQGRQLRPVHPEGARPCRPAAVSSPR